ncbi:chloride channel protein [Kribbella sp. NBC_01484]|uniref:chloride channel protein n=1 Tax=Kribbella sp. NBC_01484 TaxID=2903579 RepID=UPI002E2F84CC|nr:chloride channel protein [Kribbella sp. NBC_01484]
MSAPPGSTPAPPFAQTPQFWVLMVNAVGLGVFGAVAALLFMGLIGLGDNWYTASDPGWFGGQWWWVGVTAAAGVVVGLLRRWTHLPAKIPSLIDDLQHGHVDRRSVPGIVAVSAASLIGGASLGPEQALGSMGGGAAEWVSQRRRLTDEDSKVNTHAGFAGAYGGLFSSTVIVVMLILEVARPGGQRMAKTLAATIVSSSVSFAIYFIVAGSFFLDAYQVPSYTFKDWQLLAGIGLGLFAAVVVTLLATVMKLAAGMFGRLKVPAVVRSVIGGLAFGVVGVILPLTMFTGSDQLKTVLDTGGTLGAGFLAALVVAKILTFAISEASGFVGGPIFPTLFIGGTAGVLVHQIIPGVPLGLAFTCLLAAVPGAMISAPFALVLLAAFMTQLGALETAPVLIAVITAFLAMESVKYVITTRRRTSPSTNRATG